MGACNTKPRPPSETDYDPASRRVAVTLVPSRARSTARLPTIKRARAHKFLSRNKKTEDVCVTASDVPEQDSTASLAEVFDEVERTLELQRLNKSVLDPDGYPQVAGRTVVEDPNVLSIAQINAMIDAAGPGCEYRATR